MGNDQYSPSFLDSFLSQLSICQATATATDAGTTRLIRTRDLAHRRHHQPSPPPPHTNLVFFAHTNRTDLHREITQLSMQTNNFRSQEDDSTINFNITMRISTKIEKSSLSYSTGLLASFLDFFAQSSFLVL